jgi:hypothetical protein
MVSHNTLRLGCLTPEERAPSIIGSGVPLPGIEPWSSGSSHKNLVTYPTSLTFCVCLLLLTELSRYSHFVWNEEISTNFRVSETLCQAYGYDLGYANV